MGEDEGSSGRIRGGRSLWALGGSCIILPSCPISPSHKETSVLPPAPPSPNHPLRSPQDLKSLNLQVRPLDLLLQLFPQLQRRPFQATCNPSGFKLGASKGYISAGLKIAKRVHQPHGPLSVPMSGRYT